MTQDRNPRWTPDGSDWSGSGGAARSGLRIGHEERDACVAALAEHYAAGRLTADEYDERTSAVWAARLAEDLRPVFADLPGGAPGSARPVPAQHPDHAPGWARGLRAFPWVPVLVVLGVLSALTHVPLILVGLLVWFLVRRSWGGAWGGGRESWAPRGHHGQLRHWGH